MTERGKATAAAAEIDDGYDEEADEDFVPDAAAAEDEDEGEADGDDDDEEEEDEGKKQRPSSSSTPPTTTTSSVKDLWEKLKAKTQTPIQTAPALAPTPTSVPPSTTTSTTVYEFAGERVMVTEQLPTTTTTTTTTEHKRPKPSPAAMGRGRTLDAILGPKPKKMTTLDKSKLDWQSYRTDQGLTDTLDRAKKSGAGFLDTQAFLARADQRQYEAERDSRKHK